MNKPDKSYYVFKDGYAGNNAALAGHGIQGGSHIIEVILSLAQRRKITCDALGCMAWLLYHATVNVLLYNATNKYILQITDGTGAKNYDINKSLLNFDVITIAIEGTTTRVFLDGQKIIEDTIGRIPDFTGLVLWEMFGAYTPNLQTHDICAYRHWNYPAGVIPAGWETEIHYRSKDLWKRSSVFGDANLKLEYLLNSDIADGSLIIPNSANPGVGDLTITPAATFVNSRKLWRTP